MDHRNPEGEMMGRPVISAEGMLLMAQSGKQSSFLLDHRVHDEEVEDTEPTSQARLVASNMVLTGLWRRHYFWKSRHQMPLASR